MSERRYVISFKGVEGEYLLVEDYLMTKLETAADMEPQFALRFCFRCNENGDYDCACEFEVWDQHRLEWIDARESGFTITTGDTRPLGKITSRGSS